MIKPIDPHRTVEYVCRCDRDELGNPRDDATVWSLGGLTKRERQSVLDASAVGSTTLNGERVVTLRGGTVQRQRVVFGLRGIVRNYSVPWAQAPHPLHPGRFIAADAFLDTIPDEVFDELSAKIDELCTLTESDAGKSSPPST